MELSTNASKLWRLLTERGAEYSLTEIKRELGISKTALTRALMELEEEGLISLEDGLT